MNLLVFYPREITFFRKLFSQKKTLEISRGFIFEDEYKAFISQELIFADIKTQLVFGNLFMVDATFYKIVSNIFGNFWQ